jgi:hypothetical protein
MRNAEVAMALLSHALTSFGWAISSPPERNPGDVTLVGPGLPSRTFPLLTRTASPTKERVLEILALAHWRRRWCRDSGWNPQTGLLIRVPRLPTRINRLLPDIDKLLTVEKNLPVDGPNPPSGPLPFAICSDRGGYILRIPDLANSYEQEDTDVGSIADALREMPWHDAAVRALKILLAQRSNPTVRWWGGAREPVTTGLQLAHLAETPPSSVYGLLDALAQRGWIKKGYGREIVPLDIAAVVNWWLDRAKHQRRRIIPVRPLYSVEPLTSWAERGRWLNDQTHTHGGVPWAISGWAACHLLDLSILHQPEAKPFTLTVGLGAAGLPAFLRAWQLVECDPRDAAFGIEPSAPKSAALAAILDVDGLPVVDGWQAALDVVSDPDRGIEQATSIADRLWLAS